MSQTDTPEDVAARQGGRRRPGRTTRHRGDRCRMCGQTVVVDTVGRCPLGHQVVDPDEIDARLHALRQARQALQLAEPSPGPEDDHVEIVLSDLPPTVPSAFSTASPRFHERAQAAPPPRPAPGRDPLATDPAAALPPSPTEPSPWAPSRDRSATVAITADLPIADPLEAALARLGARRTAGVERCWVPGAFLTGRVMRTPAYLPDLALHRRLAVPGDHVLPVMEEAPPLPDGSVRGPRIARALFEEVLGQVVDPARETTADPAPPAPAARMVRVTPTTPAAGTGMAPATGAPAGGAAAAGAPAVAAPTSAVDEAIAARTLGQDLATREASSGQPQPIPSRPNTALPSPPARPAAPPTASAPAPTQSALAQPAPAPPVPTAARPRVAGPTREALPRRTPVAPAPSAGSALDVEAVRPLLTAAPGLHDLTPEAPSALDVASLPKVEPAPVRVYELLPLDDPDGDGRGLATRIAGGLFVLALLAVGLWLATSL